MWGMIGKRRVWAIGVIALLAVPAWVTLNSSEQTPPAVSPTDMRKSEPEGDFVYQQQVSVGWVFGRMIGFQGADKPLLPRQTLPVAPPPGPSFPR